jgi:hypothetical protein
MATPTLKERLIEKIQQSDNEALLDEVSRLMDAEADDDTLFELNDAQKQAIATAQQQVRQGQYLTDEQANKEIDEWLNG